MRRSFLTIPLLVLLAVLMLALPAAARKPIAIGIANPDANGLTALDNHIGLVGQTPRLWALWSDWGSRGGSRTACLARATARSPRTGSSHCSSAASPRSSGGSPPTQPTRLQGFYERYERTLNGFHDAYITQWARDAKAAGQATGKPIILRYAHEATGYWFPWSVGRFDNTKENYKAAWRYVWKIFEREGALPYVRFMWSTVFPYKWAYPGDKYVKFVGITVLNFGADRSWRTPGPLIDKRVVASSQVHQAAHHHRRVGHGIPRWRQGQVAQAGLQGFVREAPLHLGDHVPRHG